MVGMPATRMNAAEDPVPHIVTEDVQAGIDTHIKQEIQKGNGYFRLPHEDRELKLKLVRIHTEYLAILETNRFFACVDLVDISGDVFDVDFFLAGDPGAMNVTETTVHKINGQPYYVWAQKEDGTWQRVAVDQASEGLFGVIRGHDDFEFRYQAKLPHLDAPARMWLPLPETDRFQTVEVLSVEAPGRQRIIHDKNFGNRLLFLELEPEDGNQTVELRFRVHRREKAIYEAPDTSLKPYLKPDRLTPINDEFISIARKSVQGKNTDLERARALYDHVIDHMRYMKYGTGWGQGDAVYACDAQSGNCTDFHSYFIALARSVGIPARFAIGAAIPSERSDGAIDGYHCWAEFHADGKWWPVDISEGDKFSSLSTYYFGHHPANRFELSRGRDLIVDPMPASGPISFLAYPLLEVDGRPVKADVVFSFVRRAKH